MPPVQHRRIEWSNAFRLISSRFPPVELYETIAPKEDWDAVRHKDRGNADFLPQLPQLGPHLDAQLGVQIGQRLIELQHRRLDQERTGKRNTLLLSAR